MDTAREIAYQDVRELRVRARELRQIKAAGIPETFYTTEEGRFSWYVDAVAGICGPSSYHTERFGILDASNPAQESLECFRRYCPSARTDGSTSPT